MKIAIFFFISVLARADQYRLVRSGDDLPNLPDTETIEHVLKRKYDRARFICHVWYQNHAVDRHLSPTSVVVWDLKKDAKVPHVLKVKIDKPEQVRLSLNIDKLMVIRSGEIQFRNQPRFLELQHALSISGTYSEDQLSHGGVVHGSMAGSFTALETVPRPFLTGNTTSEKGRFWQAGDCWIDVQLKRGFDAEARISDHSELTEEIRTAQLEQQASEQTKEGQVPVNYEVFVHFQTPLQNKDAIVYFAPPSSGITLSSPAKEPGLMMNIGKAVRDLNLKIRVPKRYRLMQVLLADKATPCKTESLALVSAPTACEHFPSNTCGLEQLSPDSTKSVSITCAPSKNAR